jgi:hypothetical protein
MKDTPTSTPRSRAARTAAVLVTAAVATFLAGYMLFGPIAMRLLPR